MQDPLQPQASALMCSALWVVCRARGGTGPLTWVWTRQVAPTNGATRFAGATCQQPSSNRPGRPAVSIELVRSTFARTPLCKPVLLVLPPGGLTLVRLPNFYQAAFPGPGYGPDQVHTVTLLGRSVRIRVSSVSYSWSFGDGTPVLVTSSSGGPWPDGDVQHAYARPGVYSVRVTATYRGAYALDGGPWLPVNAPVPMTAPPVTLTVATAQNRLLPDW